MAPTVRVDDEVYEALKAKAEPFVDSPNDVLRRLLGLNGRKPAAEPFVDSPNDVLRRLVDGRSRLSAGEPRSRLPAGESTPNGMFRSPILSALAELGGEGRTAEILRLVEAKMSHTLNAKDREWLPRGADIRWRKKVGFVALAMQKEGLLVKGPPRGFWHLTEKGWEEARRQP